MKRVTLLMAAGIMACSGDPGPPLTVSDVDVYAPLPGARMSAAYLTLTNGTREPIVVTRIDSPQFASVSVHETRIVDGVASMHEVPALTIPAQSSVVLQEGGAHLMLGKATAPPEPGQPVTLRLHYDSDGLVIISATLEPRFGEDGS